MIDLGKHISQIKGFWGRWLSSFGMPQKWGDSRFANRELILPQQFVGHPERREGSSPAPLSAPLALKEKPYTTPGFTLLEMMISMSLVAIVILLGGQILQYFQQYQISYQQVNEQTYQSALIQAMIQQDVWQAHSFVNHDQSIVLFDRNQQPVSSYSLTDSLLIREKNGNLDSLDFCGLWIFTEEREAIQLHDTVNQLIHTFPLLPVSHSRKTYNHSPI